MVIDQLNKLFSTPALTTKDFLDQVNGGTTMVDTVHVPPASALFQYDAFEGNLSTLVLPDNYLGLWNAFE